MEYYDLEEIVFNHLSNKVEIDNDFVFLPRRSFSKTKKQTRLLGSKSKSYQYMGFTLWHIKAAYPGASAPLIYITIGKKKLGWEIALEFLTTKKPHDEQNSINLEFIKSIENDYQTKKVVFKNMDYTPSKSKNKMYNFIFRNKTIFNDSENIINQLDDLFKVLYPYVVDKINSFKSNHPNWDAHELNKDEAKKFIQVANSKFLLSNNNDDEEENNVMSNTQQVWLYSPGENAKMWDENYQNSEMRIDFNSGLTDLKSYSTREEIQEIIGENKTNDSKACLEFSNEIKLGDVIIAKKGTKKFLGYGIVSSEYIFDDTLENYKHKRKVNWQSNQIIDNPPDKHIVRKALTNISQYPEYVKRLSELYGFKINENSSASFDNRQYDIYTIDDILADLFMQKEKLLEIENATSYKKNIILQGPPGTGKTFFAKRLAYYMMGEKCKENVEIVQFHQSYSYEDFIQGFRPNGNGGFSKKNGVFYNFCEKAKYSSEKHFFIIDEINRGNLSKIFGELMMLIENDKRGEEFGVSLTYSEEGEKKFFIPENVYIIGTMNTADRSLAMVDYALRRRFTFIDMLADFNDKFSKHLISQNVDKSFIEKLISKIITLNNELENDLGDGFTIGHSYFSTKAKSMDDEQWYRMIVKNEIKPLLQEYWFDKLEKVEDRIEDLLNI